MVLLSIFLRYGQYNTPADARRNDNVIITSKMTLLLRHVSVENYDMINTEQSQS